MQVRERVGVLGVDIVVVRRVHVLPGEVEGVGPRQQGQEGALLRRVVEDLSGRREASKSKQNGTIRVIGAGLAGGRVVLRGVP